MPRATIGASEAELRNGAHGPIVLGLVNNMPDAALRRTERQFRELLAAASPHVPVRLRLFSLPGLPRADAGRSHIDENYEDIGELWASRLDGMVVTGTEPRTRALPSEPYWGSLTKLVDWAEEHTTSTVWSCLAAHGAVLHLDGLERRPLPAKLCGVFECAKAMDHPIVAGAPSRWRVPHSRYNELPEAALVSNGYRILSRSADAGADIFLKERKSLFVFMQGHPEYDPGALLREYRRDIGRFLAGERNSYPEMPRDYFDEHATEALRALRDRAKLDRQIDLQASFPAAAEEGTVAHLWRAPAVRIYGNWLSYLTAQRWRSLGKTQPIVSAQVPAMA